MMCDSAIEEVLRCLEDLTPLKCRKVVAILDTFQDQAFLLDTRLEQMFCLLFGKIVVQSGCIATNSATEVYEVMYTLCKVRNVKVVSRFFPHEVWQLESVLKALKINDLHWRTRYCLFVWLSILVLLPFPLEKLQQDLSISVPDQILQIAQYNITRNSAELSVLPFVVCNLLKRSDISRKVLGSFEAWVMQGIAQESDAILGSLQVLSRLVKECVGTWKSPKPIHSHLKRLWTNSSALIRKFVLKVSYRFALQTIPRDLGYREDVLDILETCVELLLKGLDDDFTIVRWSAAKGLARVCEKLPSVLAMDVVDAMLSRFDDIQNARFAQGFCLVCSEMVRRDLIDETTLRLVSPLIRKALFFDLKTGNHAGGQDVRDAATYFTWAFARGTAGKLSMFSFHKELILLALFDREINVRRAASAAFQETVGRRCSSIPHGVEILKMIDFYAVSSVEHCYLSIAVDVVEYQEYRKLILEYLCSRVSHWDPKIRVLAAKALALALPIDRGLARAALPRFLVMSKSRVNAVADGGILGLRYCLPLNVLEEKVDQQLNVMVKERIESVIEEELMESFLGLVGVILLMSVEEQYKKLLCTFVVQKLEYPSNSIREAAVLSLSAMTNDASLSFWVYRDLLSRASRQIADVSEKSFVIAISHLHKNVLTINQSEIIQVLTTHPKGSSQTLVDNKVQSISSLLNIYSSITSSMHNTNLKAMVHFVLSGLQDYTTVKSRDIGTTVRNAAVKSVFPLVKLLIESNQLDLVKSETEKSIGLLLQLSLEKITNIAENAYKALLQVVDITKEIIMSPLIALQHLEPFTASFINSILDILHTKSYSVYILSGIVQTIGGPTESHRTLTSQCFIQFLTDNRNLISHCTNQLTDIFRLGSGRLQISVPLLKTLSVLIVHGCLTEDCVDLVDLVLEECRIHKKVAVYLLALDFLVECMDLPAPGGEKALLQCLKFLRCKIPKLCRVSSEKLYEKMLCDVQRDPFQCEKAQEILINTNWSNRSQTQQAHIELYTCLGLCPPKVTEGQVYSVKKTASDFSYEEFLRAT